jgi:hypothetical protein
MQAAERARESAEIGKSNESVVVVVRVAEISALVCVGVILCWVGGFRTVVEVVRRGN